MKSRMWVSDEDLGAAGVIAVMLLLISGSVVFAVYPFDDVTKIFLQDLAKIVVTYFLSFCGALVATCFVVAVTYLLIGTGERLFKRLGSKE